MNAPCSRGMTSAARSIHGVRLQSGASPSSLDRLRMLDTGMPVSSPLCVPSSRPARLLRRMPPPEGRSIAVVEPSSGSSLLRLDHPLTGADPGRQPRRHIDLASHRDGDHGKSISGWRRWVVSGRRWRWAVGGGRWDLISREWWVVGVGHFAV